jgi:hypothetical protein
MTNGESDGGIGEWHADCSPSCQNQVWMPTVQGLGGKLYQEVVHNEAGVASRLSVSLSCG